MNDAIAVKYKDKVYNYNKNTTFLEISTDFKEDFKYEIVGVLVDNEIAELNEKLIRPCFIDFVDLKSSVGNRIYERGLVYLYMYAVKMVMGEDAVVKISHSIDKGVFTLISKPTNQYNMQEIEKAMRQLVNENIIFEKSNILRKEAIKYFDKTDRQDKAGILKYISNTYITLYKFKNMYDYFYGEMPYSSGALKEFRLDLIEGKGIVLSYPSMYSGTDDIVYTHHDKLFGAFEEYGLYQNRLKINSIAELNEAVSNNSIGDLIRIDETFQNQKLLEVANEIYSKKENIKIILIAGPTSSGKTTTSKKIEMYLTGLGLVPHSLSLDDFFKEKYETPKDEDGNYDFECLNAIDIELFNNTLQSLLSGQETLMPTYNFISGKKEYKKKLKINEVDVLIVEGLHGLNDELTSKIPRESKYKIYLSPLTNLNIDNCNRIHTTDTRLIRRMIRDSKSRGYNASQTISSWKDVRKGEEKYVFPFQADSDYIFNTAFVYEIGVLKTYVEPLLFSVDINDPGYSEALRLINFLRKFLPIPPDDVPTDSILREFIGNSCFKI